MSCNKHKERNEPYRIIKNEEKTVENVYRSKSEEEKIHFVLACTVSLPLSDGVDHHECCIKNNAYYTHIRIGFEIGIVCEFTGVRECQEIIATYA